MFVLLAWHPICLRSLSSFFLTSNSFKKIYDIAYAQDMYSGLTKFVIHYLILNSYIFCI